jgi:hypothetical protein
VPVPVGHDGFVQIRVDAGHAMLTVYWHGRVPADMQRLFAALRHQVRLVLAPARYLAAQLGQAVWHVLHSHSGLAITGPVGPLADGSGIQVGVAGRVPALDAAAMRKRFGTAVAITVISGQRPAQAQTCNPYSGDTLGPPARCNDLPPDFWGGAVLTLRSGSAVTGWCSTGFGVHFSNGSTGMLTAGHCILGNNSWWNGQNSSELGTAANTPFIGDPFTPSHDSGVGRTPSISGDHYYDGNSIYAGDTHNTKTVVGQQSTNPGDWVCESGAFGGVLCAIHVLNTGQTDAFDVGMISGLAQASGNTSQPAVGDSGGPVFSLTGTGTVTAKGTWTGVGPDINGNGDYLWFTPMQVISRDLGVTVNTTE